MSEVTEVREVVGYDRDGKGLSVGDRVRVAPTKVSGSWDGPVIESPWTAYNGEVVEARPGFVLVEDPYGEIDGVRWENLTAIFPDPDEAVEPGDTATFVLNLRDRGLRDAALIGMLHGWLAASAAVTRAALREYEQSHSGNPAVRVQAKAAEYMLAQLNLAMALVVEEDNERQRVEAPRD